METEERLKQIEKAVLLMQELVLSHEDRLDTFRDDMRLAREDFEFKLNALIDAQIKNEEGFTSLRTSIAELRDESKSQLSRIERLERA